MHNHSNVFKSWDSPNIVWLLMGLFYKPQMTDELICSSGGITTDRAKPKYSRQKDSQCHSIHHKSHMHCPMVETEPLCEKPATNQL
jgi:hypothetical protein